jgi:hypothetical protein
MLKKLASLQLSRDIQKTCRELAALNNLERQFERREVVQLDDERIKHIGAAAVALWHELWSALEPLVPVLGNGFKGAERSLLHFRSVTKHDDEWQDVLVNGRWLKPAFLHIVLDGHTKVHVGRVSEVFRLGDVFAMDMNKMHWVSSHSLCATACLTYPKRDLLKIFKDA